MSSDELEELKAGLRQISSQMDMLSKACNEFTAARRALTSSSAMEEQMVSVVRGLNDRWREHTDAITRFREAMDHMTATTSGMRKAFDLLYNALIEASYCPMHGKKGCAAPKADADV